MRWMVGLAGALLVSAYCADVSAFCGFYVGGSDGLKNDATQVVLMRSGRQTVMTIQNNYEGPPEDFALVVPVPTVLSEADVDTLPHEVLDRIDRLGAPRLVEYWEQDPCPAPSEHLGTLGVHRGSGYGLGALGTIGRGAGAWGSSPRPVVRVEAEFAVDEYDVVILSADESTGLERWLRSHGYRIPRGASRALRPYVEAGTKFFVARVDASRLSFDGRRAQLSPLRVHYESDELALPIRLGLLNARGPQDLIVHVLAPRRYEVANRPNRRIPTNLRVREEVRGDFSRFYAALFDATLREHPGAVVTEYAWSPTSCDPCPGPTLTPSDLARLGGDVIHDMPGPVPPAPRLAVRGELVSLSEPEGEDEPARLWVRRGVRRGLRAFDQCVRSAAATGRAPRRGSFRGHIGFLLLPGGEPVVELVGDMPAPIAQCLRAAGRRAVSGEAPITGLQGLRAQINATWSVPRPTRLPRLTLTRLHLRYRPGEATDDLVFREVGGLVGGRGAPTPQGTMSADVTNAGTGSAFQGRYAILHEWTGPVSCPAPRRGIWGGPIGGRGSASVRSAEDLGEVRRRRFALRRAILSPVPELGPPRRRRGRSSGKAGAPIRKRP